MRSLLLFFALLAAAVCQRPDTATDEPALVGAACEQEDEAAALKLLHVRAERRTSARFLPPITREVTTNGVTQSGFVLEFAQGSDITTFECIPGRGGLITAFKFNGVNVLVDHAIGPSGVWGSTFWTSPQSDWGWPPPAAFDTVTYEAEVDEHAMAITLRGPLDQNLGVRVTKRFALDLESAGVRVDYTLELGAGHRPQLLAPWEISRLPAAGAVLYPSGSHVPAAGSFELLPVKTANGVTWFDHGGTKLADASKLLDNSTGTWIAHTRDRLAFIKRFRPVPQGSAAPGEGNIEIFAMDDYSEMENQGSYIEVSEQRPLRWSLLWYLRALPTTLGAEQSMVDFANFVSRVGQEP